MQKKSRSLLLAKKNLRLLKEYTEIKKKNNGCLRIIFHKLLLEQEPDPSAAAKQAGE